MTNFGHIVSSEEVERRVMSGMGEWNRNRACPFARWMDENVEYFFEIKFQ